MAAEKRFGLVFQKDGKPLNRKTVATAYNAALKRLGIIHVSGTHMLRKTASTQANRVTGDVYAVQKMLDHASPNETMNYVEELSEQKVKVAHALDQVLTEGFMPKVNSETRLLARSGPQLKLA
jgi:integrase